MVVAVSTAMTPTGLPSRRARPVTTERAQPGLASCHVPLQPVQVSVLTQSTDSTADEVKQELAGWR